MFLLWSLIITTSHVFSDFVYSSARYNFFRCSIERSLNFRISQPQSLPSSEESKLRLIVIFFHHLLNLSYDTLLSDDSFSWISNLSSLKSLIESITVVYRLSCMLYSMITNFSSSEKNCMFMQISALSRDPCSW